MIKSAAKILAEIAASEVDEEDRPGVLPRSAPLKRPGYRGYWVRQNRYPDKRKPREMPPRRTCELVPGCDKPHAGLGGCWKHYYRLRTYGDPLGGPQPRVKLGKIEGLGEGNG
jgi:hypothetical protein